MQAETTCARLRQFGMPVRQLEYLVTTPQWSPMICVAEGGAPPAFVIRLIIQTIRQDRSGPD